VRRASLQAPRENLDGAEVRRRFFEASVKEPRPSVAPEMERAYRELIA
jgi:SpoVK/Ycf46/Vps4 family AAA+-type ATPase